MVAVIERVPSVQEGVTVQSDQPSTLTTGADRPVTPAVKSWL